MPSAPTTWIALAGALLSGGSIKIVIDVWREWRGAPSRRQRQVDANIKILASTRDELAEDNSRYRKELTDQSARHRQEVADIVTRHAAERQQWLADQGRLRADIIRLEQQITEERAASAAREREVQERYDVLWETVQQLRRRAGPKESSE